MTKKTYPQNPVEVLFVHSQEVTVVLSQDNGGSTGSVIDESELPKVVSFVKSTNDTLWQAITWSDTKSEPITGGNQIPTFP